MCADPMYSIVSDRRREDCTIWAAVAPDAVLTVRTYERSSASACLTALHAVTDPGSTSGDASS